MFYEFSMIIEKDREITSEQIVSNTAAFTLYVQVITANEQQ